MFNRTLVDQCLQASFSLRYKEARIKPVFCLTSKSNTQTCNLMIRFVVQAAPEKYAVDSKISRLTI